MPNSSKSRDSRWRDILWLYESIPQLREKYKPMSDLVRWLESSDYAALVSPSTSHFELSLIAENSLRGNSKRGCLHIAYEDRFSVWYQERDDDGGLRRLTRAYAQDEIRPAVEAWLWRLQMEAQIAAPD